MNQQPDEPETVAHNDCLAYLGGGASYDLREERMNQQPPTITIDQGYAKTIDLRGLHGTFYLVPKDGFVPIPCTECGGKGFDTVQSSRGPYETDDLPCSRCNGRGYLHLLAARPCDTCDGYGKVDGDGPMSQPCPAGCIDGKVPIGGDV